MITGQSAEMILHRWATQLGSAWPIPAIHVFDGSHRIGERLVALALTGQGAQNETHHCLDFSTA
jgi:hypothetical protein